MVKLNNLDVDVARSDIDELICRVLVLNQMSVRSAFLHPDRQAIHAVGQSLSFAIVTS